MTLANKGDALELIKLSDFFNSLSTQVRPAIREGSKIANSQINLAGEMLSVSGHTIRTRLNSDNADRWIVLNLGTKKKPIYKCAFIDS